MSTRSQQWPWFAIQVRSSCEKTSSLLLENAGYACFLPFAKGCAHREGFEMPLFPGYFFCRMNPHHRVRVLTTPGVVQIVGVGETPIPIEEREVEALQRLEKSGLDTMPWPYMQAGHMVRLEGGPLRGLSGIVVRVKFGIKLVLSISVLQHAAAVAIERHWISPASLAGSITNEMQTRGRISSGEDYARYQ